MKRTRTTFLVCGALALAAACGSSEPVVIDVTARLVSPHGNEGAAVLEFDTGVAGVIQAVTANGAELFVSTTGAVTRVVIVRLDAGELVLSFRMDDTADNPGATVIEVAGPDDMIRSSLDGYRVEFVR